MKQTTKNILGVAAVVILSSGVAGVTTYKMLNKEKPAAFSELFQQNPNNLLPAAFHATDAQPVDLTQAAESSLHAVVHIRATQLSKTQTVQEQPDIFDFFFGDGRGRQRQIQTQPRRAAVPRAACRRFGCHHLQRRIYCDEQSRGGRC